HRAGAHLGPGPGGGAPPAAPPPARPPRPPPAPPAARAVAMIGTGRTTMGIVQFTDLGPDDVVVVPAAAGGIGTLLVQYAKNAGATVLGLAGGPAKTALVLAGGADAAIDYTRPDWPSEARAFLGERRATVVYDSVGGETARAAVDLLGEGGRHIVFGWSGQGVRDGGPLTFTEEELTARGITSEPVLGRVMLDRAGGVRVLETRALAEAAAGRLRPAVQCFPLREAAEAHRALETRRTTGKVVLVP
ncbi:zinc-binding dehydrogenase, partial [Streptomyces sp. Act-28]